MYGAIENKKQQEYQDNSGRPSTMSNYVNQPFGQGTFSDGASSSTPNTNLNTPYQNMYQSRTISPF